MSAAIADRDVIEALDAILAWEPLRRSPQLAAFLRYIVEAKLRNDVDAIKAYAIAVDVFGRPDDFDPQSDPIVRVQARRLRSLLTAYYAVHPDTKIRIHLPLGRYVPEFTSRDPVVDAVEAPKVRTRSAREFQWRRRSFAAAIGLLLLLAWGATWMAMRGEGSAQARLPQPPIVFVAEFENLTADVRGVPLVAGLAVELVTDLELFEDVRAQYGSPPIGEVPEDLLQPVFAVSGVVRRASDAIQYSVLVTDARTGEVVHTIDFDAPVAGGAPEMTLDDVARTIAMEVGSPRGPLHRAARDWVTQREDLAGLASPYLCMVLFNLYRERPDATSEARARYCVDQMLDPQPDSGPARAMLAALTVDAAWREGIDLPAGENGVERARELARSALSQSAVSAFVWEQAGYVDFVAGDMEAARQAYSSARQLNPAATDAVAGFARVHAMLGNWTQALRHSEATIAADPAPPDWYAQVPALHALRQGDYAEALEFEAKMVAADPELGAAFLVAAGGFARNDDIVTRYLPRLLVVPRYRREGILPALRRHIVDPELMRVISSGISLAGLPVDRLVRPF
jgi:TolB-like protein